MKSCYACGGSVEGYAKGGDVKGVHKSTHNKGHSGQSMAGYATREVKKGADVDKDSFKEYARGEHKRVLSEMKGMRGKDRKNLAEGGFVEDEEMSGYPDMPSDEHLDDYSYPEDIVGEIMMDRAEGYSEGGKVANDTETVNPDSEPSQYDDLVLRDDLEFSYTGENSGDELGEDMVDEIMKARKKRPA